MLAGQDGHTEVAIIEFETKEDALGALSRDQKLFNDNVIEVQLESGSTLWVTNFPPTADEEYIRGLFGKVSELSGPLFLVQTADSTLVWPHYRCAMALAEV